MATTPEKASAITFTSTILSDVKLPITTMQKSDLITWLNSVQGTEVAFYFSSQGSDSSDMFLMLGEKTQSGISGNNPMQSDVLPCPDFCKV